MSLHYIGFDRANNFTATIQDNRRNAELKELVCKGFDTVNLTLTKEQLQVIGDAIAKETGGNTPF